MAAYDWITLTTDYGLSDGYTGVLHGVIAARAPWVRVIDVTHLVPPGDVSRGAAVLAQAVGHLPPAVHVGVVDPGVGTGRRAVAIETPQGMLVGPDNGLLTAAADALGGARAPVRRWTGSVNTWRSAGYGPPARRPSPTASRAGSSSMWTRPARSRSRSTAAGR